MSQHCHCSWQQGTVSRIPPKALHAEPPIDPINNLIETLQPAKGVTFSEPEVIPDVADLTSDEIRVMYLAFLELVRAKIDVYVFDWVELEGTLQEKWDLCYQFTILMMRRKWSHVPMTVEQCITILVAAMKLAKSKIDAGDTAWCPLADYGKADKMYEFLMRLAEQNGVSPDIVFPGAERTRGMTKRRSVMPVSVDDQSLWDDAGS